MASYISIPRDLSKVKTKVFFNLTKRQLICFGAGAAVGLPVFFVIKLLFGADISSAVMGMMIIMLPFFLFAMYEKNGQPLEKILKQIINARFKSVLRHVIFIMDKANGKSKTDPNRQVHFFCKRISGINEASAYDCMAVVGSALFLCHPATAGKKKPEITK